MGDIVVDQILDLPGHRRQQLFVLDLGPLDLVDVAVVAGDEADAGSFLQAVVAHPVAQRLDLRLLAVGGDELGREDPTRLPAPAAHARDGDAVGEKIHPDLGIFVRARKQAHYSAPTDPYQGCKYRANTRR